MNAQFWLKKWITPTCLLFLLFSFEFAHSSEGANCNDPTILKIERPLFLEESDSATFQYSFQRVTEAQAGFPTVIILPGGPGECAIEPGVPSDLPEGFGLIRTDPRGLCCNFKGKILPQNAISTLNLAHDILAIVKSLRLDRYILYGVSYGTELATVTAGLAEKGEAPIPYAVVLEGVLGRAFHPGEVFEGFLKRWEELTEALDVSVLNQLRSLSPTQTLLGLPANEWSSAIVSMMLIGAGPKTPDLAERALTKLSDQASPLDRQALVKIVHVIGDRSALAKPETLSLYQEIACRELASEVMSPSQDLNFSFANGMLKHEPGELCKGKLLDLPYDASQWMTSAPIYYFEGGHDPSTPMSQAQYHFHSQKRSRRTFVTVPEGGHIDFIYGLKDCSGSLWLAIAKNGSGLSEALQTCDLKTEIETAIPN